MKIEEKSLDALHAHAAGGYPDAVCGVLLGPPAQPDSVTKVVAVANRESDAPSVRYRIAPADWLRVQGAAHEEGLEIVGFYHSHPGGPEQPCDSDRRIAAQVLADGVFHIVIGVGDEGKTTSGAFVFRTTLQGFQPVPLDVIP